MSVEAVIEQALKLSVEEREEIVTRLREHLEEEAPLDPNWEAAWTQEIDRRIEDIREGRVKLIDSKDVFAEARAIAGRRR
jgi:putative addiction module component (TIGR02574 family)